MHITAQKTDQANINFKLVKFPNMYLPPKRYVPKVKYIYKQTLQYTSLAYNLKHDPFQHRRNHTNPFHPKLSSPINQAASSRTSRVTVCRLVVLMSKAFDDLALPDSWAWDDVGGWLEGGLDIRIGDMGDMWGDLRLASRC